MADLLALIHAERTRRGWSITRLLRESGLPESQHAAGYRFLAGTSNSGAGMVGRLLAALGLLNLRPADGAGGQL